MLALAFLVFLFWWIEKCVIRLFGFNVGTWENQQSPPQKDYFNRKYILQQLILRGHVSFGGCTVYPYPAMEKGTLGDVPLPC